MKISKVRENARVALKGKWGKAALITLAYLAFFFVVGIITGIIEGVAGEDSLIVNLLSIGTSIIQVPIVFGLSYAFIKLKRNEEAKAFEFLKLGFSNFGRAWKIGLRTILKMILPVILVVVSIVLIVVGLTTYIMAAAYGSAEIPTLLIVGLILYFVALIFMVVASLLYSLTTYVAFDNPNMNSLEVVNESAKIMRGNRGKLFLLELSFIGWMILTVLTLGIGYLWLLPYMQVAAVCFYEELLGKNENSDSEGNVEAITEM